MHAIRGFGLVSVEICTRSLTVLAPWLFCRHCMVLELLWRFLFLANGWWKAGISSQRLVGALVTDNVVLYFCAAIIISLSEMGR